MYFLIRAWFKMLDKLRQTLKVGLEAPNYDVGVWVMTRVLSPT